MTTRLQLPLFSLALLFSCACGAAEEERCRFGDPGADMELIVTLLTHDGVITLADGADAPLFLPAQGGQVMMVGVRASNLAGCDVDLAARLRDPELDGLVLGSERRVVAYQDDGTGWAQPEWPLSTASFANVPLCPSTTATRDLPGRPLRLEIDVVDAAGRQASRAFDVIPSCAEGDAGRVCRCACRAADQLGEPCE